MSWGEPRGPVADPRDRTERDRVLALVYDALATDGVVHKQWYLEQIVAELEGDAPDHEPGRAP